MPGRVELRSVFVGKFTFTTTTTTRNSIQPMLKGCQTFVAFFQELQFICCNISSEKKKQHQLYCKQKNYVKNVRQKSCLEYHEGIIPS